MFLSHSWNIAASEGIADNSFCPMVFHRLILQFFSFFSPFYYCLIINSNIVILGKEAQCCLISASVKIC